MTAEGMTVSVHLDEQAGKRVKKAASLTGQSSDAFLERAGDGVARRMVLEWAVQEYRRGQRTFGEIAEETGLAIEEIMMAMSTLGQDAELGLPTDNMEGSEQVDPALYRAVQRVMSELRRRS
jgi:hypothetical protein